MHIFLVFAAPSDFGLMRDWSLNVIPWVWFPQCFHFLLSKAVFDLGDGDKLLDLHDLSRGAWSYRLKNSLHALAKTQRSQHCLCSFRKPDCRANQCYLEKGHGCGRILRTIYDPPIRHCKHIMISWEIRYQLRVNCLNWSSFVDCCSSVLEDQNLETKLVGGDLQGGPCFVSSCCSLSMASSLRASALNRCRSASSQGDGSGG